MIENLKFYLTGAGIVFGLFLAYSLGQSNQTKLSFESAYEIVKDAAQDRGEPILINANNSERTSYVAAYSHIYLAEGRPLEMAITLSLRNIDKTNSVSIQSISYFNTQGQLIRRYLKDGYNLGPLETKEIFIKENDTDGGSGANFFIDYKLAKNGVDPIFESIMVSSEGLGKSFIFSSRGRLVIPSKNRL